MTYIKPRPFHIGSRLRFHDKDGAAWIVVVDGVWNGRLLTTWENGSKVSFSMDAPDLPRHADDGAPLGEWEPLSRESYEKSKLNLMRCLDSHRNALNSILRREESQ